MQKAAVLSIVVIVAAVCIGCDAKQQEPPASEETNEESPTDKETSIDDETTRQAPKAKGHRRWRQTSSEHFQRELVSRKASRPPTSPSQRRMAPATLCHPTRFVRDIAKIAPINPNAWERMEYTIKTTAITASTSITVSMARAFSGL